ncbi:glutamine-hydrolyzing carbamoyl-phosphate synthase small subunit [Desulfonatronovibrio hydrogenovorans]|uniref:glutamine-hydrolyzing carbamoyl-phosphate synthase small subunit n=1 Tax=Desulfonatronovibrio hydrogenovorans TaxID=53245 RepID=UPI00048E3FCF|nr:glutamine-hydrolyzing carbamoyl-phosphate synthase small subunit [Desulfonatronovibrio hydrogenovorans]
MKAILALEDGTWFEGQSFTGPGESGGEVIFNTGMTGYQEIITDPSYVGQMVCMTYPLIGNYGVNPEDVESDKVQAAALIVKECCKEPSNWRSTENLPDYLSRNNVMGIEGIDTRALTTHLRIHGAMRGIMSTTELDPEKLSQRAKELPHMEGLNLGEQAGCKAPYAWTDDGPIPARLDKGKYNWPGHGPKVLVYDYGTKWNILRLLKAQGVDLLVVPASFTFDEACAVDPDGIFLTNGPGDPAAMTSSIETIAKLADRFPIAGICLGHQLLGLALGGKSFKLKFGHHGANHPVKDLVTEKIEISSQNHGFCVDISQLDFLEQTHVNLNDQTLEGFRHKTKPIIAVQHHPEASSGPHDSRYFFRRFMELIDNVS